MAVNVYLTIYHRFDVERLVKLEIMYLFLCYGVPLAHALCYLIPRNNAGQRVYGGVGLWCWVTPSWDTLRIVSYAIVWYVLVSPASSFLTYLEVYVLHADLSVLGVG